MPQPIVHFEIAGKDSARTRDFYSKMFGWEYQIPDGMDYALVAAAGEGSIGGGVTGTQPGQPPYITIYAQVDDLKKYMDKADKLGGKTIVPPTPIPGGAQFALLADPDGLAIGIYHMGS